MAPLTENPVADERLQERLRAEAVALDLAINTLRSATLRQASAALSPASEPALSTAIQAIAAFLGVDHGLEPPRERASIRTGPMSEWASVAERVEAIAFAFGLQPRAIRLSPRWWSGDFGAILCFFEGKPVAVLCRRRRRVLVDPETHEETPLSRAVARQLEGSEAFMFYRTLPPGPLKGREVVRFAAAGLRRETVLFVLLGAGQSILGIAPTIATGILLDSVIPGAQRTQLVLMTALLGVAAVAATLLHCASCFVLTRMETRTSLVVQAALWRRLLLLPAAFFRRFAAGELAARANGIDAVQRALTGPILSAVLAATFSLIQLPLLFYYSWRLAIPATIMIAIALCVAVVTGSIQTRLQRAELIQRSKIATLVYGVARGIAKLRVNGAENRLLLAWAKLAAPAQRTATRARRAAGWRSVFSASWPGACSLMLYWLGMSVIHPVPQPGDFLAFLLAFGQLQASVAMLSLSISGVVTAIPNLERLKPILAEPSEVLPGANHPGRLSGHVLLDRVAFRYRREQGTVLRNVTIEARPGEFIGIVGPSGSGKSTLLRLLLGFDQPESGAVFFDGQNAAQLDMSAVRKQMGVVLQDARLFAGDMRSNICGSAERPLEEVWRAAEVASIAEDIRAMPMGMQTPLSEDCAAISGGQRQRLLIARALAGDPRIVVMDEATSALDNLTQARIIENMQSLRVTRIAIAHRLSTIRQCDRIYVLQDGAVVETGSFAELMERDGLFTQLARRQSA